MPVRSWDWTREKFVKHFIKKQNKHLTRLIDRILDISIWEKDQVRLEKTKVHIFEFVEEKIRDFRVEMHDKNVDIQADYHLDKDYIKPEFHFGLDEIAAVLRNNPGVNMVLEGNTCSIGTEAYNLGLSDRRANQVYKYLVNGGVSAANLSTVGYGFSNPAASNDTEDGRKLNRRTEMVPSIR